MSSLWRSQDREKSLSSAASGTSWKTHRSTSPLLLADNGAAFTGERAADYAQAGFWTSSSQRVIADINACKGGNPNANQVHLRYTSPYRFGNGANYLFCDMHAQFLPLDQTLNLAKFMWGKSVCFAGSKPIFKPGTTNIPVE